MSSKEPRPLPKPGDPQYRDPKAPRLASPPPPPKRRTIQLDRCCHERRVEELEKALLYILEETESANGSAWKLKIINRKCREALTGEGE